MAGAYRAKPLPPPRGQTVVDGYRFTLHGATDLKAIQAGLVTVDVTDPQGKPGALHAVVRRARPRDLLPPRLARLLPHARLRARRQRLHERARRRRRSRALSTPGQAEGRGARARARDLAAVPPGARSAARSSPCRSRSRSARRCGSSSGLAAPRRAGRARCTRAIVYALKPHPRRAAPGARRPRGGPRLAGVLTTGVAAAALVAAAVLWLAAVAVRERRALEGRPLVERAAAPAAAARRPGAGALRRVLGRLRAPRVDDPLARRARLARAHCLVGPVHRDAIPILAALVARRRRGPRRRSSTCSPGRAGSPRCSPPACTVLRPRRARRCAAGRADRGPVRCGCARREARRRRPVSCRIL